MSMLRTYHPGDETLNITHNFISKFNLHTKNTILKQEIKDYFNRKKYSSVKQQKIKRFVSYK